MPTNPTDPTDAERAAAQAYLEEIGRGRPSRSLAEIIAGAAPAEERRLPDVYITLEPRVSPRR